MKEDLMFLPPPPENAPVKVILAGQSWCDGSYRIRRPATMAGYFVFEYVISGSGTLKYSDNVFHPKSGDVYIVHAGYEHEYYSSADQPWVKLWFNIGGSLVHKLVDAYLLNDVWHIPDCDVRILFEQGLAELRENPLKAHENAAIIIHRIIQQVAEIADSRQIVQYTPEAIKLKNYLDTHPLERIALPEMAAHIKRSPAQTVRLFKKYWGSTPYQYHINRRLELAALSLTNSSATVKEIAFQLGFDDEFYFSNLFKSRYNISPKYYRRSHYE